jgi:hypothetical protein
LIAACLVLARMHVAFGERGWAAYSGISGVLCALGFGWAMSGGHAGSLTLFMGVVAAWVCVGVNTARLVPNGILRPTTALLLTAGLLAGPIYIVVGLAEAVLRPGFDLSRHSLSLLANGDFGWIHSAMMVVTGLLTVGASLGLQQALPSGSGRRVGPILVGVYGLSVAIAGLLTADPAMGFPLGIPDGPPVSITWHGMGHFAAGGIGFLYLIAACFVFTRRFGSAGQRGWAAYSAVTGVMFLAGFAGIASGNASPVLNVAFGLAVVVAWTWVSLLCARTRNETIR